MPVRGLIRSQHCSTLSKDRSGRITHATPVRFAPRRSPSNGRDPPSHVWLAAAARGRRTGAKGERLRTRMHARARGAIKRSGATDGNSSIPGRKNRRQQDRGRQSLQLARRASDGRGFGKDAWMYVLYTFLSGCRADRGNRATGNAPFPDHLALDIPEGSAAFARQGQRRFARSENHGLENSGSVCHVEAEMIGGVP